MKTQCCHNTAEGMKHDHGVLFAAIQSSKSWLSKDQYHRHFLTLLLNFCTHATFRCTGAWWADDGDCARHCTILTTHQSHTEVHKTGNEDPVPASHWSEVLSSGLWLAVSGRRRQSRQKAASLHTFGLSSTQPQHSTLTHCTTHHQINIRLTTVKCVKNLHWLWLWLFLD